jgi:hypothetical protein
MTRRHGWALDFFSSCSNDSINGLILRTTEEVTVKTWEMPSTGEVGEMVQSTSFYHLVIYSHGQ